MPVVIVWLNLINNANCAPSSWWLNTLYFISQSAQLTGKTTRDSFERPLRLGAYDMFVKIQSRRMPNSCYRKFAFLQALRWKVRYIYVCAVLIFSAEDRQRNAFLIYNDSWTAPIMMLG